MTPQDLARALTAQPGVPEKYWRTPIYSTDGKSVWTERTGWICVSRLIAVAGLCVALSGCELLFQAAFTKEWACQGREDEERCK